MVMEYAQHGSMYDMLKKKGKLQEDEARRYVLFIDVNGTFVFFVFVFVFIFLSFHNHHHYRHGSLSS